MLCQNIYRQLKQLQKPKQTKTKPVCNLPESVKGEKGGLFLGTVD